MIVPLWTYAWEGESSDWVVWGPASEPDADGMTCQPAICTLSDSSGEDEARLIAAAPCLLEALSAVYDHISVFSGERDDEWHKEGSRIEAMVIAAIRRAQGEGSE